MIIADFECPKCGHIHEDIIDSSAWEGICTKCGEKTKRIMTLGGVNCANEDALHIRQSAEALLDMDVARQSKDPIERALANSPTRSNLKAYLKHKNLRYVENENGGPPVYRKPRGFDMGKVHREVMERFRMRNRLEIRTV